VGCETSQQAVKSQAQSVWRFMGRMVLTSLYIDKYQCIART
jgi:hypothetical protein